MVEFDCGNYGECWFINIGGIELFIKVDFDYGYVDVFLSEVQECECGCDFKESWWVLN